MSLPPNVGPVEAALLREHVAAQALDRVWRLRYTEVGTDEYGKPLYEWQQDEQLFGNFVPRSTKVLAGISEVSDIQADLYLPLGTEIDRRDRVRHTTNFLIEPVVATDYEIVGDPLINATNIQLELRRVTDGS